MFLLVLLLVPVAAAAALWYHHRRLTGIKEWAGRMGWSYVGSDRSLASRWSRQPFGTGHARRVSEALTGPFQGRQAVSFTYRYTTGSGKNQTTVTHHVLAMRLPAFLPTLELTPDGLGARLAKVLGGQDIQFESEDFNQAWRVVAPDNRFAHDVVHPRLMERLLRADARGLSMRIEGTDILCWSPGATRLDVIGPRLQVMAAVVNAVPRFVWLDHGYDPGTS
ncbi:hypothetical protein [Actinotalea sp. K2]|uniref:hypothetical protein n=1 Tax=Actinotalea sp. K2 TaxID=2939438 RepID=UPI002017E0DA|nr:hypothetical protein [Actinotalea sp. K2]MCL3863176.1 hypothetical protein [Actinotalea sp. K2]